MTRRNRISLLLACLLTAATFTALGAATLPAPDGLRKATFAGGCFWSMEHAFEGLPGVVKVISGYTGGREADPGYEQVSSGSTGHAESVEILFDPHKTSFGKLLNVYWHNIDPTEYNRQFCDAGSQYRTVIFYHSEHQKRLALASRQDLQHSPRFAARRIYTQVEQAGPFYAAEDYHQDYAEKNPVSYKMYRLGCGRDRQLEAVWGRAH